eukprot:gi/632935875/ref/XP_007891632.1/ PREDICTED: uncharacterized protein LOC103178603 [Callorhinchus milii]
MEKQVCPILFFILGLNFGDSAHLFAPQEVTGQLRKSIILPCSYKASHFYTEKQVTWYFGKHGPILHRNASEVHTFPSFNQKKLSINSKPRSGNVSLTLENLQYSDMGTYTCEVTFRHFYELFHRKVIKESVDITLFVKRSIQPTMMSVMSTSESSRTEIALWVFVLSIILILVFCAIIVLTVILQSKKRGNMHQSQRPFFPENMHQSQSVTYENFPQVFAPSSEEVEASHEYEKQSTPVYKAITDKEVHLIPTSLVYSIF